MLIKIHKAYRAVVAVCDSEILGKKFEEGIKQLDVRENFYNGEKKTESEMIDIMRDLAMEDSTFNLVGKKTISCALKAGLISQEGVKHVSGVPFALVLL